MGNVLLFLLKNNIDIRSREVRAMTPSLFSAAPGSLLIVLVLPIDWYLIGLALMGGHLTRHVSSKKTSKLGFSRILLLLFSGPIILKTP